MGQQPVMKDLSSLLSTLLNHHTVSSKPADLDVFCCQPTYTLAYDGICFTGIKCKRKCALHTLLYEMPCLWSHSQMCTSTKERVSCTAYTTECQVTANVLHISK